MRRGRCATPAAAARVPEILNPHPPPQRERGLLFGPLSPWVEGSCCPPPPPSFHPSPPAPAQREKEELVIISVSARRRPTGSAIPTQQGDHRRLGPRHTADRKDLGMCGRVPAGAGKPSNLMYESVFVGSTDDCLIEPEPLWVRRVGRELADRFGGDLRHRHGCSSPRRWGDAPPR